jgi:parallel beta-helix repeat protein
VHLLHPKLPVRVVSLILTALSTFVCEARASTLVVPDQAPTVQAALDAAVDTILVQAGTYPETSIVSTPVAVLGMASDGAAYPVLGGLVINVVQSLREPLYDFQRIAITNQIKIISDAGVCDINFNRCNIRNGIDDASLFGDTWNISLFKCIVQGYVDLWARGWVYVDSCEVSAGQINICGPGPGLLVRGCTFVGAGGGSAIRSCPQMGGVYVEGNVIRRYALGIGTWAEDESVARDNVVEDCTRAIDVGTNHVTVENNTVRRCERGIKAYSRGGVVVRNNRVTGATVVGIFASEAGAVVTGNVVWDCPGDGIRVQGPGSIVQNTSVGNGWSGFGAENGESDPLDVRQNIAAGNGRYGLWLDGNVTVSCNDWFGNSAGEIQNGVPAGDLTVDPVFCDPDSGDFSIDSSSPLVDVTGCGQVGALGVGCGKTATLVQRFAAGRTSDGIRVIWEVADGGTASEIWLERSESPEGASWSRPLTEQSVENGAVVELDRSAAPDRAYWYRLVALEGSDAVVIGAPIVVEGGQVPAFRFVEVGPNPAGGPVKVVFALKHPAMIAINVYDVQGRRVASLGRGSWPAGTHMVEWSGLTHQGETAPAGLYFLRYQYPGGQDRRAIIRTR